jgi:chorismate-pyruvate lyase
MRELYDLRAEAPGAPGSSVAPSRSQHALPIPPWAGLLQRFYSRSQLPLPPLVQLKNEEVPQPYQQLLVHSSDMTPTLERFYCQPLALTVLSREIESDSYYREVVLRLGLDQRPVEYGVIRIFLAQFPARARRRVLEEHSPLGNILQTEAVAHLSWPQAFFRTQSDAHMHTLLGLNQASELYGRRNVLLDGTRRLLAEVIEILAPPPRGALS